MADTHRPSALERLVHWTLLTGLAISALMLVAGLGFALGTGEPRPDGEPPSVSRIVRAAAGGDGVALLDLGLLMLILTPVLRVAVLAIGWAVERDWRFAAVAVAVLGLLGLGFVMGLG